ncbi:helix-turn-helix transcriptional regulator [Gayadomonas joobiniege]|uniref:helix-turn-helix transcriptional regulator n=1 Tax=Gayadomonas joobiniege TaxID=1234606 RepID=UPI00037C2A6E|nr:AraC family transcriptional regulator [Gayadomonas joobiniege]
MSTLNISWDILIQGIVPFGAANVFLMVLVYFSLVRYKMQAYGHFATFMLCFTFFLTGPLINMLPFESANRYYDLTRNILLFAVGIPSVCNGLLTIAQVDIKSFFYKIPYVLGFIWCGFFLTSPPLSQMNQQELPWPTPLFDPEFVYLSQVLLVNCILLVPCCLILFRIITEKANTAGRKKVIVLCLGTIWLCLCMTFGLIFKQWGLYYGGASVTALVWAWAVFQDIRQTQLKQNQHHSLQNQLAIAQFSAPSNNQFSQFYPQSISEAYPFREREAFISSLNSRNKEIVNAHFNMFSENLAEFCQHDLETYRLRAKEVLFMLFDSAIYRYNDSSELIATLEASGKKIKAANSQPEIDHELLKQAKFLATKTHSAATKDVDLRLIEQLKQYMLAHYHQNLNLELICEQVGISRSRAIKLFKQKTGQTINQYLIQVRMEKAKQLLTVKSVTETAFEVGFNNSAYFSTAFKKHTGQSPKAYQKNMTRA